jgi:U11/U12 small nuclear ribonucleoprotein SNRNP48
MAYCLAVGVGDGAVGGGEGEVGASGGAGEIGSNAGDVVAGRVFLSQVAAAIMALYERFSLEKTKALQAQRPSKHQLYAFLKSRVLLIRHCIVSLNL